MDVFTILFWVGITIILLAHIMLFQQMPQHSTITLIGLACTFVGSKIGRKFLGIE